MPRRYESAVREERASHTRAELLAACEALLLELPVEEVTLPAVARRAGVSKPTAYSHFPDNDALLGGFVEHVRERIGMQHAELVAFAPEALPRAVRDNYRRFEESERLLRRVMDSPSYNRVRLARKVDRAGLALPVWKGAAREAVLRERLGPLYMLVGPQSWRWLRDTWGLDGEQAARAASWAMSVLANELTREKKKKKRKRKKERSR